MDYKKLAGDLLSGCEENCADCEYAGDSEFECTISQLAVTAITELLARAEAADARADKAERERDAAVKLIDWIYSEVCISVEHDMRQHLDWLKDKIEQWIEEGVETDDIEDCEEDVSAYKVFMDKAIKLWKEGKE